MRHINKFVAILMTVSLMISVNAAMAQKSGSPFKSGDMPANYQMNTRAAGFTEDFSGEFPPMLWQNNIITGDHSWEQEEGDDYFAAAFGGFSGDGESADLISPRIDLTTSDSDVLSFIYMNEDWLGDQNVLEVYLSTNGGTDWNLLDTYDYNTGETFEEVEIDLEGYDQTDNAHIKFKGINYFGYAIQITDVQGPAYYYNAPAGFTAEASPESTSGNAKIDLNWEAPEQGATPDEYKVYRKVVDGEYTEIAALSETTYTDEEVESGQEYVYYVAASYTVGEMATQEVNVTAQDGPAFAINPESHEFEEVALLDGDVYYDADNQTFTVTNEGVGTLTIQEPYFFSGSTEDYNLVVGDGISFPYDIEGPHATTGESLTFEVDFEPVDEGASNTLLVVEDNLSREVRTFSLSGSAHDIPDYDLTENAMVIDQDWNLNFDYAVEDASFEEFYNDYNLAGNQNKDVVYKTTVDRPSYLEFTDFSGVDDFAVIPEGEDVVEDNNIYEDGQTAIEPGTYYFIASGQGAYNFNIHIEGQEPELVVEPAEMPLGDVPIGAWHQGGTFKIYNAGGQSLTINDITTSDENGVFSVEGHYEYPYDITTDTMFLTVYCDAETAGDYEGALLVEDDVTTHIYDITASAYQPVEGDVVETAYEVEFNNGHYENSASIAHPMRNNYELETENVNDVVYSFSVENDVLFSASLTDAAAGFDGYMKVYDMSEVRAINPDNLEPVLEGESFENAELYNGEYILILRGSAAVRDAGDYTISLDITDMPAPGAITLDSPEDGAEDVELNTILEWTLGEYTSHVDVYLDTQYPPQTKVLEDAQATESYETETLDPQQVYFWKVVAKNENATTESETYGFTTILPPPLFVTGEVFDFTNVHLEWNSPFDAVMSWTKDFENGEMPEGWTTETNATGSTAGWIVTEDGGSSYFDIPPHSYYAVANDDAMGSGSDGSMDYMITDEQDFSTATDVTLTFDSYFTGEYSHVATVELSTDGGETWEVVHEVEAQESWADGYEVDLSEYATEDYSSVWIGFHSDDSDGWASGWAVDNVTLEREFDTPYTRDFVGYNIYQNGTKLNEAVYTETEYDVMDLAAGTYEFGVSAVYNEGESEIVTIEEITIDGEGTIEGQVVDADSNEGIEGATLTFAANDTIIDSFTATTDADGNYSKVVPVLDGGYTVTAAATGYEDVSEEDVMVEAATSTTVDFVMGEVPLPVSNVVATKGENDEQVTVTWDEPTEYPTYEIVYDDGNANNATAWNAGYEGNMNAIKFTPSGYPANVKTAKIHIFDGSWPEGDVLNPMEVVVLDDDGANGLPGTELGSIEITPESPNWVTVDLTSLNITIDEGDFYIANRQISTFPDCPPTAIAEDTPAGRSYSYSDGSWGTATYDCFMIRAEVSGPQGDQLLGYDNEVVVNGTTSQGAVSINEGTIANGTYQEAAGNINVISEGGEADRALQHYEIYRYNTDDADNMDAWTMVADDVTETEYVDGTWADVTMGTYKYAVKAVYTVTESDPVSSNMVAKDMKAHVVVIVDLNTGNSPEGATVTFQNTNIPDTTYEYTVPASGTVNIENFWKGNYNLTVSKENYDTYQEENIDILEDNFIRSITLKETLAMPVDLATDVDCESVTVSWEQGSGGGTAGDEFTEGFENNFPPEGWEHEQTNSLETWEQVGTVEFSSGDVVPHEGEKQLEVYWEYEEQDEWMITPEFTVGNNTNLTFWTYLTYGSTNGDHYYVKVSEDGGNSWDVIWDASDLPEQENHYDTPIELDLSEYQGSDVKIAWNAYGAEGLWYAWFIDDVTIASGDQVYSFNGETLTRQEVSVKKTTSHDALSKDNSSVVSNSTRNNREFIGYNVYRDGELLTSEPITETEYTDDEMSGGTYNYEVSAVYSTGESMLAGPVEAIVPTIVPVENFTANATSFNNAELEWDPVDAEGLAGYHIFRNEEQITDEPYTETFYVDYDIDYPETYEYYVVAVYDNGCMSDASNIETISFGTGVGNEEEASINIFPNPATDVVKMNVTDNIEQLRVMNSVGQMVHNINILSKDVVKVNVSDYNAGTYIVQFTTESGNVISKRFIVVK